MSESIKCFQFLSENVPSWLEILETLEQTVKTRQTEISRVPVPTKKLRKSGSNESLRPRSTSFDANAGQGDGEADVEQRNESLDMVSAPQDGDMAHAQTTQDILSNSRKRKTASVLSCETIPAKYRSRSMIVVYYDSEIQRFFEQLVRHIGAGRNNIRRARMASRMRSLAEGSATSELSYPEKTKDSFESADAALEKAQSFCERGAHQFLRDGDCRAEITGARASFSAAKTLSDTEIIRLRELEDQRSAQEPDILAADDDDESDGEVGVLEVDNEEEISEEPIVNMARFRLTART